MMWLELGQILTFHRTKQVLIDKRESIQWEGES